MIFKNFLNCFFPSFNSKIETWVICEHTTHPPTSPTQHTNTPTKNKNTYNTQIHNTQPTNTQHTNIVVVVQQDPKKKKCYECKRVRHKGAQCVDNQI